MLGLIIEILTATKLTITSQNWCSKQHGVVDTRFRLHGEM